MPFDTAKDFAGVSMVVLQSIVLVAHSSFEANTLAELIALAKSKPDQLDFASSGPRGVGHLAGEMLKHVAAIQMQHINYQGSGPALTDVLAARVPIMFDIWHSVKQHVADGRLKVIAFTGLQRQKDAPQYPTIAETYPGFDATSFQAIITRAGLPAPLLDKLSVDIRAVVALVRVPRADKPTGRRAARLDARGNRPLPAQRDQEMGGYRQEGQPEA